MKDLWFILHPSSFILPAMSYRAFKRLLGETSLERKCRFLFGAFILLLISGSFLIYASQTEHLAYDQIATASRLLATQIVDRRIATVCRPPGAAPGMTDAEHKEVAQARDEFRAKWEEHWPLALKDYRYSIIKPDSTRADD